ncbi:MAG: flagellar motor protein MotB [Bacillota bacterium]|nr:flagellar motor protein MotB [Bacillota bacterium]
MSRKKKAPEKEPNSERYMLTYSDLITLLMIFFIVLYSMSNVDSQKYQQVAQSLSAAMGGGSGKNIVGLSTGTGTSSKAGGDEEWQPEEVSLTSEQDKLSDVKKQVDNYLNKNNLTGSVETIMEDRGLVLRFKDSLFFDTGKADVKPAERTKLVDVGKILNAVQGNYIRVEGNTDNVPINTSEFASNWQLSGIRATNVVQILAESGIDPKRLQGQGRGEYNPIAANSTESGRAQNRRVDIIILDSKYSGAETNN